MRCHLKKCIQPKLDPKDPRVEMRSFSVPLEVRAPMHIDWDDDGDAMFHDICWKAIVDSCRTDNPFTFGSDEIRMIRVAWKTAEYHDSQEKIQQQAKRIARMIEQANYVIAFTGAGISTSAGICDFRGKCGKWTERDRERLLKESNLIPPKSETSPKPEAKARYSQESNSPPPRRASSETSPSKNQPANTQKETKDNNNQDKTFDYETRRPTYTHEALCKMVEDGHIKHIISQNTDGLHRLSGVPPDRISELHGNSFVEKCEKCHERYERQFAVRRNLDSQTTPKICNHCRTNHRTGRFCPKEDCDGELLNTIINFGDGLEHAVLSTAEHHANQADLVLCLGSSLSVKPACDLIEVGKKPMTIAMCNRQLTPFDSIIYVKMQSSEPIKGVRVFTDCDILIEKIMEVLYDKNCLDEWNEARPVRMVQYSLQRLTLEEALRQGSMPKTPKQPSKTEWPEPENDSDDPPRGTIKTPRIKANTKAAMPAMEPPAVSKPSSVPRSKSSGPLSTATKDAENNQPNDNVYSSIQEVPKDLKKSLPSVRSTRSARTGSGSQSPPDDVKNANSLQRPTQPQKH